MFKSLEILSLQVYFVPFVIKTELLIGFGAATIDFFVWNRNILDLFTHQVNSTSYTRQNISTKMLYLISGNLSVSSFYEACYASSEFNCQYSKSLLSTQLIACTY